MLFRSWADTLEDVVERRLLLAMGQPLSTTLLRSVAEALVAAGRPPAAGVATEVEDVVAGLRSRHGLRVADGSP